MLFNVQKDFNFAKNKHYKKNSKNINKVAVVKNQIILKKKVTQEVKKMMDIIEKMMKKVMKIHLQKEINNNKKKRKKIKKCNLVLILILHQV